MQSAADEFYADENFVGARERAANLGARAARHAAEGLCSLSADRRSRDRSWRMRRARCCSMWRIALVARQCFPGPESTKNLLPALFESPDVCGKLTAEGAAATGLKVGTPVVAGAGDQAAGAVGMGIVRAGVVSATIGTSGVVFAATDRPALDPKGRLHTFCHAIPGRWHVMGVTQAAGLSLRWFRDKFGVAAEASRGKNRDPYEFLSEEAAAALPGCGRLAVGSVLDG